MTLEIKYYIIIGLRWTESNSYLSKSCDLKHGLIFLNLRILGLYCMPKLRPTCLVLAQKLPRWIVL